MDEDKVLECLEQLVNVTLMAGLLFKNDLDKAKEWIVEPNELLFSITPLEVCMCGDADYLIKWLEGRLGLQEDKDEI